jgi:hypothetical protein
MKNLYSQMQAERDRPPVVEGANYFQNKLRQVLSLGNSRVGDIRQPKFDGDITTWHTGLPEGVEVVSHGGIPLRHYSFREKAEIIVQTGILKAGKVPYARGSRGSRTYFQDLTGIFLTTTGTDPGEVGVGDRNHLVDVVLPPDVNLLKIEEGIYLIPSEPGKGIEVGIVSHSLGTEV